MLKSHQSTSHALHVCSNDARVSCSDTRLASCHAFVLCVTIFGSHLSLALLRQSLTTACTRMQLSEAVQTRVKQSNSQEQARSGIRKTASGLTSRLVPSLWTTVNLQRQGASTMAPQAKPPRQRLHSHTTTSCLVSRCGIYRAMLYASSPCTCTCSHIRTWRCNNVSELTQRRHVFAQHKRNAPVISYVFYVQYSKHVHALLL